MRNGGNGPSTSGLVAKVKAPSDPGFTKPANLRALQDFIHGVMLDFPHDFHDDFPVEYPEVTLTI